MYDYVMFYTSDSVYWLNYVTFHCHSGDLWPVPMVMLFSLRYKSGSLWNLRSHPFWMLLKPLPRQYQKVQQTCANVYVTFWYAGSWRLILISQLQFLPTSTACRKADHSCSVLHVYLNHFNNQTVLFIFIKVYPKS